MSGTDMASGATPTGAGAETAVVYGESDGQRSPPARRYDPEMVDALFTGGELADDPRLAEWCDEARRYLREARRQKRRRTQTILSVSCLLVFGVGSTLYLRGGADVTTEVISAPLHATRTVRLEDGSTIVLDRRTTLSVRLSADSREITLNQGQARFMVHHDADRPFRVVAGDREVRATGTDFNVMTGPGLFVTSLIQGGVVVSERAQQPGWFGLYQQQTVRPITRLASGQQFLEKAGSNARVQRFKPDEIAAWQQGRVVLDREPLASAALIFNRYSTLPIEVAGPGLRATTLSGIFATDDAMSFAQTVATIFPEAEVHYLPDRILIAPRPAQKKVTFKN